MENALGSSIQEPFIDEEVQAFQKARKMRVYNSTNSDVKRIVCAGLDVHKVIIVASICITDPETLVPTYYILETKALTDEMYSLCKWLRSYGVEEVCMESTGKYWIPIFNFLQREGFKCVLTHPKYVKSPKGAKNDRADAMRISNMFRMDYVIPSFIPPDDIRQLRELTRYRIKLCWERTAEKNRYQNSLQECNIRLDTVFKDVFGKSAMNLMETILEKGVDGVKKDELGKLIDPRVKAEIDDIYNSYKAGQFIGYQFELIQMHLHHIDENNYLISTIDLLLDDYREKYKKEIELLMTIPGVSDITAINIIAEIGADMSIWKSVESFCCWCGVVPASNSSARKHKTTKIGSGGYYLKPFLVQCANAAIKSTEEPYYAIKYKGIMGRRGHKKAIIAIAHKMCIAIYYMLKNGTEFHPCDYDAVMKRYNAAKKVSRQSVLDTLTMDEIVAALKAKGMDDDMIQEIISAQNKKEDTKAESNKGTKAKSKESPEGKSKADSDDASKGGSGVEFEHGSRKTTKAKSVGDPKAKPENGSKAESKEDCKNGSKTDSNKNSNSKKSSSTKPRTAKKKESQKEEGEEQATKPTTKTRKPAKKVEGCDVAGEKPARSQKPANQADQEVNSKNTNKEIAS